MNKNPITIQVVVNAPIEKVWQYWNDPQHITQWAFASDDWESPHAENDLRVGQTFSTTMAAKDGSQNFDFAGTYTKIDEHKLIEYDLGDVRQVSIVFETTPEGVEITQTFDPEQSNSREMQQDGWQAILNNFKKYVENN